MIWEPVSDVLSDNNKELRKVIQSLRQDRPKETDLILSLSVILARSEVLEEVADYMVGDNQLMFAQPLQPPRPAVEADVEDDNPEQEDKDAKKAREEERGFFG